MNEVEKITSIIYDPKTLRLLVILGRARVRKLTSLFCSNILTPKDALLRNELNEIEELCDYIDQILAGEL